MWALMQASGSREEKATNRNTGASQPRLCMPQLRGNRGNDSQSRPLRPNHAYPSTFSIFKLQTSSLQPPFAQDPYPILPGPSTPTPGSHPYSRLAHFSSFSENSSASRGTISRHVRWMHWGDLTSAPNWARRFPSMHRYGIVAWDNLELRGARFNCPRYWGSWVTSQKKLMRPGLRTI